jgi:hypothetical protein
MLILFGTLNVGRTWIRQRKINFNRKKIQICAVFARKKIKSVRRFDVAAFIIDAIRTKPPRRYRAALSRRRAIVMKANRFRCHLGWETI